MDGMESVLMAGEGALAIGLVMSGRVLGRTRETAEDAQKRVAYLEGQLNLFKSELISEIKLLSQEVRGLHKHLDRLEERLDKSIEQVK